MPNEMVRINARITKDLNTWLDNQPIPKSTVVLLALEQYRMQKESLKAFEKIQTKQ